MATPFQSTVQTQNGSESLQIDHNCPTFVLGANGSGKSSLLQFLATQNSGRYRRISAHRQTWMHSGATSISAQQLLSSQSNISSMDSRQDSRWMDHYADVRPNLALFNLIDSENVRAREIANLLDIENVDGAMTRSNDKSPLRKINSLLRGANFSVQLSIKPGGNVEAINTTGSSYSVAELSDGERNAMLLAIEVLTAPTDTLLLVDEPERHLHRSIISPLLNSLFDLRPDCAFVVSTHDIDLCQDNASKRVVLLRGCQYQSQTIVSWDLDVVDSSDTVPDLIKRVLIGARKKVLFVEGEDSSLDLAIYRLIFPNVSVIAKGSCRNVEQSVAGLRGIPSVHWVKAWGLIDNDRRTPAEIEKLKNSGIFALACFSVESLYYHPETQKRVSERQSAVLGTKSSDLLLGAQLHAIEAIKPHVQRLAIRVAERETREKLLSLFPKPANFANVGTFSINLDLAAAIQIEVDRLNAALENGDLQFAIANFPVRETPALDAIAKSLKFLDRQTYEKAVIQLYLDDASALTWIRSLFGGLINSFESE